MSLVSSILLASLSWNPAPAPEAAPIHACEPPSHVVLITIDGFRPEFYLDVDWPAPTLRTMAGEGVWSRGLRTVFPSLTYPSHTSLVTGVAPADHGILYNSPEGLGGPAGQMYFWADSMRATPIWERVRAAGGTTAGFWWPVTIGATLDTNLPVPPAAEAGESRLALLRSVANPPGFIEEMEARVTGPLSDEAFRNGTLQKERHLWEIGRHVVLTRQPNLLLYHVVATDEFQHEHTRNHPDVRQAVSIADSAVAVLIGAYREAGLLERTTFIVTGDHGFADYSQGIAPNIWLADEGYLTPDAAGIPRARFVTGGGFAFLLLRDPADQEVVDAVRAKIEGLPDADRFRFDVLDPSQLKEWGVDPRAQLGLSARPGIRFEARVTGSIIAPTAAPGGVHGHRPDLPELETGFLVWGAGIQQPGQVGPAHNLHIAPLVARLLGLSLDARWSTAPWFRSTFCTIE